MTGEITWGATDDEIQWADVVFKRPDGSEAFRENVDLNSDPLVPRKRTVDEMYYGS